MNCCQSGFSVRCSVSMIVVICGILWPSVITAGTSAASLDKDLLLYAPFDGSLQAEFAAGSAAPIEVEGKPAEAQVSSGFLKGVKGEALVIGGEVQDGSRIVNGLPAHSEQPGANVCFSPEKNINMEEGTISFWLQPLDWCGTDAGFNVFFRIEAGSQALMCYKFFQGHQMLVLCGEQAQWTRGRHRIGHWQKGQWRHIAMTWNKSEVCFYVDGELVSVSKVRFPISSYNEVDILSVGPGGGWSRGYIGRSLIDEFRIHGRALSANEIIELYGRDAGAVLLDTGLITVGMKSVTLDGIIEREEYPFKAGGFSNLEGLVVGDKSQYAFSFDEENLYMAVETKNSGFAEGQAVSVVELLLWTDFEKELLRHLVFKADGGVAAGYLEGNPVLAETVAVKQSKSEEGWTLESAIPLSELGGGITPGGAVWRFNIALIREDGSKSAVSPVLGSVSDRSHFLELHLRADAPMVEIESLFNSDCTEILPGIAAESADDHARIDYMLISDLLLDAPSYALRTRRTTLFENGKGTSYQSRAGIPEHALRERMLIEFRVEESSAKSDDPAVLFRRRFIFADQSSPMAVRGIFTKDRQQLVVAAERRAEGEIQIRFIDQDMREVWRSREPIPDGATYFDATFDLDFEKLNPAIYTVYVEHLSADDVATRVWEQEYLVPGEDHPYFTQYVDPEADKVPLPWTPVTVTEESGATEIGIWGRSYTFAEGFLVSSLVSQGEELLQEPVLLTMNGEPLVPSTPAVTKLETQSDIRVELKRRADLGELAVENQITVHFDGYCEVEMTLRPADSPVAVKNLTLDFPLKSESIELVRDNRIHSSVSNPRSGAVGDYWHQSLIESPCVWAGNDKVGFNWVAPDLKEWRSRNHRKNVEIIREGEKATVRFNLADTSFVLNEPITFEFGFTMTPSRPLDLKVLRRRQGRDYQSWCQPWEYFAVPEYDRASVRGVKNALQNPNIDKRADEVFLYMTDWFISPYHSSWSFFEQEWALLPFGRAYGDKTGNWKFPELELMRRATYTRGCTGSEGWRNFLNHTRRKFFQQNKEPLIPEAFSYYFDTGIGATGCQNEHHGCSTWTDMSGVERGRMFIKEERELWINARRMIQRTNPDARIMVHFGWRRAMPLQTFTDMILTGEGPEGDIVANGGYYGLYTPEFFRVTFSPYIWGISMLHIDENLRALSLSAPDQYLSFSLDNPEHRRQILYSFGYCLVHDTGIHASDGKVLPLRRALWAAQDELGWDENVVFHPYWENAAVRRMGDDIGQIMASAYTKDGKLLLALLNDGDDDRVVPLELDLKRLGVVAGGEGYDVFEEDRKFTLQQSLAVPVASRDFRLILWK